MLPVIRDTLALLIWPLKATAFLAFAFIAYLLIWIVEGVAGREVADD